MAPNDSAIEGIFNQDGVGQDPYDIFSQDDDVIEEKFSEQRFVETFKHKLCDYLYPWALEIFCDYGPYFSQKVAKTLLLACNNGKPRQVLQELYDHYQAYLFFVPIAERGKDPGDWFNQRIEEMFRNIRQNLS